MCGIAGILSSDGPVDRQALRRMTEALRHRGPDDDRVVIMEDRVGFGHARLSIIDLAGGRQPMASHDRRFWITYNGEIYNYRSLRARLREMGCSFRTDSDTEVVLEAFRTYGSRSVHELDGMYAFAIWDSREQLLFAARDPFAKKPFYHVESPDGTWFFASEIKALLASQSIRGVVDYGALDDYLRLSYIPPHRTIYRNISVLPPGHHLTRQRGRSILERYWTPGFGCPGGPDAPEPEMVERLRILVTEAVKKRTLASDVPVGAFLSGGLDSSTVVALMSRLSERPVKTFTVGFGKWVNELPLANAVARRYGTEHHGIQLDVDAADLLVEMGRTYDEPFGDSSSIPTFLISRFAGQEVKVVLTGDGGDELFGGYTWLYGPLIMAERVDRTMKAESRRRMRLRLSRNLKRIPALGGFFEAAYRRLLRESSAARLARDFQDPWDRHLAQMTHFGQEERASLWRYGDKRSPTDFEMWRPQAGEGIDRALYLDACLYLPGDILRKVDRAAMANSLEVRAPLLDRRLAEFAFSLPHTVKFNNGTSKYLFRKAFSHLLPESLLHQPKLGFGGPVAQWLRSDRVRQLSHDLINSPGAPLWGVLKRDALLRHFDRFYKEGIRSEAYRVWGLLCLLVWEREWSGHQQWT
ncbi:MAG: asparagine synthase (glutamine-hydrolyzing) [Deltaproteobacteria bacterium]|nr:asparagine synthase (glutamine-hydrolyzing) [Deltaproteobacteria bacterium]